MEDPPLEPSREPLSREQLDEIAEMLGDLPALPEVVLRAMRLAEAPDWELSKLDATIRDDQALAARVLRLANSAFFGVRCTIGTLQRAINIIGVTRLRAILLTAALERLHESQHSNFSGKVLWEHALATGCVSQYLATEGRHCDPEKAFMAGLLHDIGRPIMDQALGDQYAGVVDLVKTGAAASWLSAEQRVFRFDHTDIGFVVVTAWGFPPEIVETVCFHHDPTMAERDPLLCATVSLANSICAKAELGPHREPDLDLTRLPSTNMLELDARAVDRLWEQVSGVVEQSQGVSLELPEERALRRCAEDLGSR